MARKIKIALIGRRNVGKSTLFNALLGQRRSIVADIPGVTRDVVTEEMDSIEWMDTPGLDILLEQYKLAPEKELETRVLERTRELISNVDMVLLLFAYPEIHSFEHELADLLRKQNIPIMLVINKVDSIKFMNDMADYYALGFSELIPISALSRWNLTLLKEKIALQLQTVYQYTWHWEDQKPNRIDPSIPCLTIIGRPNSGKSTLLNQISQQNKAIVSDVPGTTRDSINTKVRFFGQTLLLIDTAGIRKQRGKLKNPVERFAFQRTEQSIKKSHVVLHLLDPKEGITETDKKILDISIRYDKQVLFVINKWDMFSDTNPDVFWKKLWGKFPILQDYEYISISAQEGQRIRTLVERALALYEKARQYIPTSQLNKLLHSIQKDKGFLPIQGKLRMYYLTQVAILPPTIVFFINSKKNIKDHTKKFLTRMIRKSLRLDGVNIKMIFREKKEQE